MTKFLHNKFNRVVAVVMVACTSTVGVFTIVDTVVGFFS